MKLGRSFARRLWWRGHAWFHADPAKLSLPSTQAVVGSSTEVSRTMFYKRKWNEEDSAEIHLDEFDVCEEVYEKFLKIVYSKDLKVIADKAVFGLLILANKYNLETLAVDCKKRLCNMCKRTRWSLEWAAILPDLQTIKLSENIRYVQANVFVELWSSAVVDNWLSLDIELIKTCLKSSDLVVSSEQWAGDHRWCFKLAAAG